MAGMYSTLKLNTPPIQQASFNNLHIPVVSPGSRIFLRVHA